MTNTAELISILRFAAEVYAELAEGNDVLDDGFDLADAAEQRWAYAAKLESAAGDGSVGPPALATALGDWREGTSATELVSAIEHEILGLAEKVYFTSGPDAVKDAIESVVGAAEELLRRIAGAGDPTISVATVSPDGFADGSPEDVAGGDGEGAESVVPERDLFPVWFGTNRAPFDVENLSEGFSGRRSADGVRYGLCLVHVPKSHKLGSLGSGLLQRIWHGDDRLRVHEREGFPASEFWQRVDAATDHREQGRHAVVFMHGYNVTFDEGARRAAQIGTDLGIRGPMSFFSWPSRAHPIGYIADGNSIEASAGEITDFLVSMATLPNIEAVHVIAHSMGNRGALAAVTSIAAKAEQLSGRRFGQFILAAADVDAQVFRNGATAYGQVGSGTTLYVSPNDIALRLSERISAFPRAGRVPPINVVEGIDTVDVGHVNLSLLGHGYFAEAVGVLRDMHDLITTGRRPANRFGLDERRDNSGGLYWAFKP